MNKLRTLLLLVLATTPLVTHAQESRIIDSKEAISVGLLNGGGSLIGFDYENLVSDNIGVGIGAGLVGFGAGINFHFDPTIRSSGIRLGFNNQGTSGDGLAMRTAGITYLYRNPTGILEWQLGLVHPFAVSDDVKKQAFEGKEPPDLIMFYSIGAYYNL